MSKNDTVTKRLAKKALKPEIQKKPVGRIKTSIYVEADIWEAFRAVTAYPRGRTSDIIEDFMKDYLAIHKK